MLSPAIKKAIFDRCGADVLKSRSIGGGSTAAVFQVDLADGRALCVKTAPAARTAALAAEVAGLNELRGKSRLLVPETLHQLYTDDEAFLVSEYLPQGGSRSETALGKGLAELHRNTAPSFGFSENNYIGPTVQKNKWSSEWGGFFVHSRLACQIQLACEQGRIAVASHDQFAAVAPALETLLNSVHEPPSLLHGDLWSGNVLFTNRGPALIDPAVYYGHRETDIAFSELFGGFGKAFYTAYCSAFPLEPGYRVRKEIYNLYHILNHANIFGGSYCAQAVSMLQSLPALLMR